MVSEWTSLETQKLGLIAGIETFLLFLTFVCPTILKPGLQISSLGTMGFLKYPETHWQLQLRRGN